MMGIGKSESIRIAGQTYACQSGSSTSPFTCLGCSMSITDVDSMPCEDYSWKSKDEASGSHCRLEPNSNRGTGRGDLRMQALNAM